MCNDCVFQRKACDYCGKLANFCCPTYGGTESDGGGSVMETSDGGYALAGHTYHPVTSSTVVDSYFVLVKIQPSPTPTPKTQPTPSPPQSSSPTTQPSPSPSPSATLQLASNPTFNFPLEYAALVIVIVVIAAIGVLLWKRR